MAKQKERVFLHASPWDRTSKILEEGLKTSYFASNTLMDEFSGPPEGKPRIYLGKDTPKTREDLEGEFGDTIFRVRLPKGLRTRPDDSGFRLGVMVYEDIPPENLELLQRSGIR